MRTDKKCEADDIGRRENDEEPWIRELAGGTDENRFESDRVMPPSSMECKAEEGGRF